MGTLNDDVLVCVDEFDFLAGVGAPQAKYCRLLAGGHRADDGIGKALPPLAFMGVGLVGLDGEHRIEQQHTSLAPCAQVTLFRRCYTEVSLQLLENVAQRGRRFRRRFDGEAQPVGLSGAVIGVLAQQQHLDVVQCSQFQGREHLGGRGENLFGLALRLHKGLKLGEVGGVDVVVQGLLP